MYSRRSRRAGKFFANDLSFLNAELLSREAVLRLPPRMVMSRLVARNFSPTPALFGETVSFPRPGTFQMTRKDGICDAIVTQPITGDRVEARLDQWPQVAFNICDGETRDVATLIREEFDPAIEALAEGLDYIVSGQVHRFYAGDVSGHLGGVLSTNVYDYILDAMSQLDENNVPDDNRILTITNPTLVAGLKNDLFVRADASGSTDALRRANLGELAKFQIFQPSNTPKVAAGNTATTNAVNVAGGLAAGSTAVTFDGAGTITVGMWVTIAGDDTPQHVTANAAGVLTIYPGLRRAVADNAVITGLTAGAVNLVAGYRGRNTTTGVPGWAKEITIDGFTVAPKIGQGVTFGAGTDVYSIIGVNGLVGITLDRPLENTIADNATVNLLPAGQYNMAFRPNAFALILRPLQAPISGAGVQSRTRSFNNISVRVTIGYDITTQAHKVVLDLLAGINILDANQVVPMYG